MFKDFFLSEIKKWVRDPLTAFMIFYPLLFGSVVRFILPVIAEQSGFILKHYSDFILAATALITPLAYGALIAFSVLDDRDDNILIAIRVTPLNLNLFLAFRTFLATFLAFIATIFVLWFANITTLPLGTTIAIAFLNSLAAPMTTFFINAFANNKIEGFAVMKGFGMIIIIPVVSLIFTDIKEFIFAFAPGFWTAKALSVAIRGEGILQLSFNGYYFGGLVYVSSLILLSHKLFMKKVI
ncbi:ABC transporter permease [Anaerobranca gottschalkii]|uniref:Fluoroquinolone transport system permease protein n=1 Tax=Anaerobranca gottschalkii DSM 13577 TaxID=1120990 RepID=A0A1H9YPZ7_9FIRM|nr:ABC transporter permease [Anaerobranca gottschalkii]SES70557.1 fluoroquinolone transport system permease protein [Anaerobranca gottschalkii DSM 13577]